MLLIAHNYGYSREDAGGFKPCCNAFVNASVKLVRLVDCENTLPQWFRPPFHGASH